MERFFVVYLAPAAVLKEWMQKPEEERKEAEDKMMVEWNEWVSSHKDMLVDQGFGLGKTKQVTADGVSDITNDMMLYSIVQASSHQEAAEMFKDHPHLQIPQASIEIMSMMPLQEKTVE